MLFTDFTFLFFFLPVALALHGLCNRMNKTTEYHQYSRLILFVLTLIFYGYQNPKWLIPFFISIVFDFVWATLLTNLNSHRKLVVCVSIVQNLGLLALYKYRTFAIANLAAIFPEYSNELWGFDSHFPKGIPAGISFYTFESLSFVIDTYRRQISPPKKPLEFFAFIGMFPRFIAGPIVRYKDMAGQFQNYKGMQVEAGIFIFIVGLALKTVFADNFALFVPFAFNGRTPSFLGAWIGSVSYMMQLYFDFSGYSLMAIGLGRALGFQFPTNFNRPYLASSLQDFWRRWHISLSTWLRDYLYLPLGGSRNGTLKTYRNLFLTMLLGGIWHGANWTFLLWGAWHGILLVCERAFNLDKRLPLKLNSIYVLTCVLIGWVFFRADSVNEALIVMQAMGNPFSSVSFDLAGISRVPFAVLSCLIGLVYCFKFEKLFPPEKIEKIHYISVAQWAEAGILFSCSLKLDLGQSSIPFLYFQF